MPDWYFMSGSNKIYMGYSEVTWTCRRTPCHPHRHERLRRHMGEDAEHGLDARAAGIRGDSDAIDAPFSKDLGHTNSISRSTSAQASRASGGARACTTRRRPRLWW